MSAEENEALVRRYVEGFVDQANFDLSEELFAPNFVRHGTGRGQEGGVEDLKHFFVMLHSGFPGLRSTIEDLFTDPEGEKVVLRFTSRGTHQGEFMGIAPTGEQVTMSGIDILRIADGKIAEMWNQEDALGMMQQIGAIPEPGQSEEASPT